MDDCIEIPIVNEAEPLTMQFGLTNQHLHWVYAYSNGYSASIVMMAQGLFSVAAFPRDSDMISQIFSEEHGSSEDYLRFDQVGELLVEIASYPAVR